MVYLFTQSDKIREQLSSKFNLLLLDYDGTLAPIAQNPGEALIPKRIKELLQELSKKPGCSLGIISGRSLEDIKSAVGIKDIIYVGNHGLEIKGPKINFESQVPPGTKLVIRNIAEQLTKRLADLKGILVEDKRLTLSIHYRLVEEKDRPVFERIFSEVTAPYASSGKIKINSGKKVYEIKPPAHWNKGKVVLWLLARQQFALGENEVLPVYIGDDVTDEDAFKALKGKGLTVFVGRTGNSAADYYLKDTNEVAKFLHLVLHPEDR